MKKTLDDHVNTAMMLLKQGLRPYVEQKLKERYGDSWLQKAADGVRRQETAVRINRGQLDAAALLEIVWNHWYDVFRNTLSQTERTLVSELWGKRHSLAHQEEFDWDNAYRTLDSVELLLRAVFAEEADSVKKQKEELRRIMIEEESRRKGPEAAVSAVAQKDSNVQNRHKECEAWTLFKRYRFTYRGTAKDGVIVEMREEGTKATFSASLFKAILNEFSGKTIVGGFSMTNPPRDGFGWWIQNNSGNYGNKLTPRHASFIAAILVAEGYCTSQKGRGVILKFPKIEKQPLFKALLMFLSLYWLSCSQIAPTIDQTKFETVNRAAKTIEASTQIGVAYQKFVDLLQGFATEILITKDKPLNPRERELLQLYEEALDAYNDSLKLWKTMSNSSPPYAACGRREGTGRPWRWQRTASVR